MQNTTLPVKAAQSYAEYYHRIDHVLAAVEKGPVGTVRTASELILPHRNTEFHSDWVRPNELEDGLFVRLAASLDLRVSSWRHRDAPSRSTRPNV